MKIYDTSFILNEIRNGSADQNNYILDLTFYETGNVLYKRVKLIKDLSKDEAQSVASVMNQWPKVISVGQEYIFQILDISCELNITFYDAAYVFTAKKFDAELLTSDKKLYDKAKNKIKIKYIKPED